MMKRLSVLASNLVGGGANRRKTESGWVEKTTMDGVPYFVNPSTKEVSWDRPAALRTGSDEEKEAGEWTWIPHSENVWQPARKIETLPEGSIKCETQDGEIITIAANGVVPGLKYKVEFWPLKLSSLNMVEDDLIMLDDINKGMIMYTLRKRYENNELYTWVGASHSVLVSVNPYKQINIYGDDQIAKHRNRSPNREISPHVFDIANDSYDSMLFDNVPQSILISGESGAGKTEATKQCLKFIAKVAGSGSNHVETKIIQANPVLEAFGNAKTIRNNNSSRFGKWIEVYFAPGKQSISSAKIINYLLEKSRLVHQQGGERNFHIFYQLASDQDMNQKLEIGKLEDHRYLKSGIVSQIKGINDRQDFADMKKGMEDLEFTPEEIEWVFNMTAFVLHLGNCTFNDKAMGNNVRGSQLASDEPLMRAKKFLGVDADELRKVLVSRSITVRNETSIIPLDPAAARAGCDSLAKGLYGRLFDWLVSRVNRSLAGSQGSFVGILDIFGFEIFENNSFEQLCINFTNEKLQQLFNKTTFKEEEALYSSEKVKYNHVEFIDNQQVLDLIERKPDGILPLLDDECLVPEGSDTKFMLKIEQAHGSNSKFQTDTKRKLTNSLAFEIQHYAGVVCYDASAFSDKNKDTFFADCYDLCGRSSHTLTKEMFPKLDNRLQSKSLSTMFRGQLGLLMEKLNTTRTRYIRCVKPNDKMAPENFNTNLVLEQLTYSGVFEAVQIRKKGFPFRYKYVAFANRYRCINPNHKYKAKYIGTDESAKALCEEILKASHQNFSEIQFGQSMVLYRANEHRVLKLLRNLALETLIPRMQRYMRGLLPREMKRRLIKAEKQIQHAMDKKNDHPLLKDALNKIELTIGPGLRKLFPGYQPRNLSAGKAYLAELQKWLDMEKELENFLAKDPNKVYKDFKACLVRADGLKHIPQTDKQEELVAKSQRTVKFCDVGKIDTESTEVAALPKSQIKKDVCQRLVQDARKYDFNTEYLEKVNEYYQEFIRIDKEAKECAELPKNQFNKTTFQKVVDDAAVFLYETEDLKKILTILTEIVRIEKEATRLSKLPKSSINREEFQKLSDDADIFAYTDDSILKVKDILIDFARIDKECIDALACLSRDRMNKVLRDAEEYKYTVSNEVAIKEMLAKFDAADEDCAKALKELDLENLKQVFTFCEGIKHDSELFQKVKWTIAEFSRVESEAIAATKANVPSRILKVLADARAIKHTSDAIVAAQAVVAEYDKINQDALKAVLDMNKTLMLSVLNSAQQLNHSSDEVSKVQETLALPEKSFVEAELKVAESQKDNSRIIHRKIRLNEILLDEVGSNFTNFKSFPDLRTPDEYASSKMMGKAKLRENFYRCETSTIPTSLIRSNDAAFKKQAISLNKNLLCFAGDGKGNQEQAAADFLAVAYSANSDSVKNEVFAQLIKHITENGNPESMKRTWDLFGLTCQLMKPSDAMEKYIIMFFRKNAPNSGKKWLSAMNEARYGRSTSGAPPASEISSAVDQFHALEKTGSRFSVHGSNAYSGPSNEKP